MGNIYFHPCLQIADALRIAHAQGACLVYRSGRMRMVAPAPPDVLEKMRTMIDLIDAVARGGR